MTQDARIAFVFLIVALALVAVATWDIAGAVGRDRDIGFQDGKVVIVPREPNWPRFGGGEGNTRNGGLMAGQNPGATTEADAAAAAIQAKRQALRAAKDRATTSFQAAAGIPPSSGLAPSPPLTPERAPAAAVPGPAIAPPSSSSVSSSSSSKSAIQAAERWTSPTLRTPAPRASTP